jgi:adenylate kinase
MEKMLNLVLFGPPGAGKGTQSENLINKYGLVHLSTGDILRTEIARSTALGIKAKEVMDKGELVGDDIVIGMIESKLDENTRAKGFIFDGFPRTAAQAIALDDLLQKKGTGISGMLALEVENEELVKRLLMRGQESGRPDDKNEEVIRHRITEYNNKTLPLKTYYSNQGKFHSIKGVGSIDEIFKALVDRITFLKAEMDLTALENDLEHLDLTIQDFDVADEIAPELLLEIDAIKRSEAEEDDEARETQKQNKQQTTLAKPIKKVVVKSASVKPKAKKKVAPAKTKPKTKPKSASKKAVVKKSASKKIAKKVVKKSALKKTAKKTPTKKVLVKKSISKKTTAKKAIKKNKTLKALKKVTKKIPAKKKVTAKKIVKKIAVKTKSKSAKKSPTKKIKKRK